jgi:hypothetical protein
MIMSKKHSIRFSAYAVFALLLLASVSIATANDDAAETCTNATLNGAYGVLRNGHAVADAYLTAVGIVTFDTIGNMSGHEAVSTNGVFSHVDVQSTYAVSSDCTGQIFDSTGAPVETIVISTGGDRVLGMRIEPGRTDWVEYSRIGRNAYADDESTRCTLKNLKGMYIFQRVGHIPAGDLLATGIITLDGRGTAFAIQTTGRNGVFTTSSAAGPYAVNADCTGTLIDPTTGKVFSEFVVVHGRQELFAMSETAGNNVAAHFESAGFKDNSD